jgi:hypothetical protein
MVHLFERLLGGHRIDVIDNSRPFRFFIIRFFSPNKPDLLTSDWPEKWEDLMGGLQPQWAENERSLQAYVSTVTFLL